VNDFPIPAITAIPRDSGDLWQFFPIRDSFLSARVFNFFDGFSDGDTISN
jgi:hypothetical protein